MLGGLAGFVDLEERLKTLARMEGGWQGDRLTRLVGDRWAERWRLEDDGSAHIVNSAWATSSSSSSSSSSLLLQPPGTPKPGWNKTPTPNVTPLINPHSTTHMPKSRQHSVWLRDKAARQRCSTDMAQWSKMRD